MIERSGTGVPPWLLPALGAALVVVLVYLPVLGLGFVWDDFALFLEVPALRDAASFWAGTLDTVSPGQHYFRPVALLTFKAQFLAFGSSSVAAHAISLAFHVTNTVLVTVLAFRVAGDGNAAAPRAAVAGLLYGLHPELIEPVAWMSCRFDLLITLWLLLALHADLRLRRTWLRAAVVAALYFLALNSKEMAAPFPAVLLLFQLATRYRDGGWRDTARRWLANEWPTYALTVVALAAYVAMRAHFVGGTVDHDADIVAGLTGVPARAAFVARTLLFHLHNMVLPFAALGPLHPVDLESLAFSWTGVLELLAMALILSALAFGVQRRWRSAAFIAAGVLALVPVLNIVPISIGRNIGSERYLTFPLASMVLALAVVPLPVGHLARVAKLSGAVVGIAWLAASIANIRLTVPLWHSDITLWTWSLERTGSEYARYSLVTALLREGRADIAARELPPAEGPNAYRALTRLEVAKYLLRDARRAEGEAQLRRALQEFPPWYREPPTDGPGLRDFETYRGSLGLAYAQLAQLELDDRDWAEARDAARIAQLCYPGLASAVQAQARAEAALGARR